jgi:hypothetical protein
MFLRCYEVPFEGDGISHGLRRNTKRSMQLKIPIQYRIAGWWGATMTKINVVTAKNGTHKNHDVRVRRNIRSPDW